MGPIGIFERRQVRGLFAWMISITDWHGFGTVDRTPRPVPEKQAECISLRGNSVKPGETAKIGLTEQLHSRRRRKRANFQPIFFGSRSRQVSREG
jgi:hypothetical protein